jgi:hypothetical protein
MKDQMNRLDPLSRREFALRTAKTALGVSLLPIGSRLATTARAEASAPGFGKAKHVIFLWMGGGMTHIDTFDPKTGSTKGPGTPVKAKAGSGNIDYLGGYLPKLAEMADKFALVRSMSSKTGVHESGTYVMKTGYEPRTTIVHPTMGAWASHFLGRVKDVTLPDSVTVGSPGPGAGFFPPALSPVPISSAETGLQNIRPTTSDDMASKRVSLMNEFDAGFRAKYKSEDVKAYTEFYEETMKLLKSEDLKAFDISQEPAALKEKYGRGFGSGCLLARRLVEHGVRFVEVQLGGWDMHNQIDNAMTNNGNTLDTALSALLGDLQEKGLLDSTLVCLGSEFGRTPDVNENSGRDHYPLAYTTFFAGAGIKGGYAYGSTDKDGRRVADKQAMPQDFLSTIGHAMGLPVDEVVMSPSGRPFTVGDKGTPIVDLFA